MLVINELPFPQKTNEKEVFELPNHLILDQWIVPKGTVVSLWTTINFGFVCLPKNCKDTRGFEIPRRLFNY